MPTEIQYGAEAGGREWALSGGPKHSDNTMRTGTRRRMPGPPTGPAFKWLLLLCALFFPADALLTGKNLPLSTSAITSRLLLFNKTSEDPKNA
uniref:Uncharacterized protein n=1 Tax=Knipowitschia caucasica TaxID=637954 RepID=A0AAV2MA42_KNICA